MELAWLGNLIDVDKFDQRADFNFTNICYDACHNVSNKIRNIVD